MNKPSGNPTPGNPPEDDDPRFTVPLVKALGQLLTRYGYRAPLTPAEAEQAYQDFVWLLALATQAFEGKHHGAFINIARLYGTPEAMAKTTAEELTQLNDVMVMQRAVIDWIDQQLDLLP